MPCSIFAIVLECTPVFLASSVWVRPLAVRASLTSFAADLLLMGFLSVLYH